MSIKHELEVQKEHRIAKLSVAESFRSGDKESAIRILSMVSERTSNLHIIESKIFYTMGYYDRVISSIQSVLGKSCLKEQY